MAIRPRIVQVSQGLRTATDPTMLADGELTRADDGEYRPGDDRIHKVNSRKVFADSAEAGSVTGGIFAQFDSGPDRIIIATGTEYKQAFAAKSGSFASLVTGLTAPEHLDAVQYDNKYHLLDGVNRIRNVDKDLVVTLTGMLANTEPPRVSNSGSGTGFTLASGTTIWYWIEERVKVGGQIVRRNASTILEIAGLTGTGATVKPVITKPASVNSDATHWAAYATAATASGGDNPFPVGAEIAEAEIGTDTIEDTRTDSDPGLPDGEAYEIVTVSIGGAATSVAKWGPPPTKCDTGDIFEDSLVVNDKDNPRLIKWAFFDTPDAWPSINRARIGDTKWSDDVVLIRRLSSFLCIMCKDSMWRMHILPISEDAAFQPQRVRAKGQDAHGCTGPKAGDLIDFGRGVRFSYVSRYALMITDGFSWDDISDDLDWKATFDVDSLDEAVLIYNPEKYRLQLYARPVGGSANSVGYYFHLHPSHSKTSSRGGVRAKVTGPITVPNITDAFLATIDGERRVFVCSDDGNVYLEDEQDTDDAGFGINFVVQSAEVYPAGAMEEAIHRRVGVHHSAAASEGQAADVTLIARKSGQNDTVVTRGIDLKRRELTVTHQQGNAESYMARFENSDEQGSISVDYFVLGSESEGPTRT